MSLKAKDKEYIANTYNRFPVEICSGKGVEVYDENGKKYIDLTSGIGVTAFGMCDEEWVKAVTNQLNTLQHTSNLFYTSPSVELAELLCTRTGLKKVFFCNSGAESNECAIKVARKYSQDKYGLGRHVIVTLVNSFHGRTITTLSATGQDHFHKLFQPLTDGFIHITANSIEELKQLEDRQDICAILMECVQGEGGVIPLDKKFVLEVEKLCKKKDLLLMIDEVQTGNGRTGELYAFEHYGILPDVVSTAKGLGNGLPFGATMLGEKVQNVLGYGDHATTFGANPVCSAGALSVIKRMDRAFLDGVKNKSKMVFDTLTNAKGVISVSGMGLMIGIKTERNARDIVNECIEKGVLCLMAKDKVRLLPALNISNEKLTQALEILKEVIGKGL